MNRSTRLPFLILSLLSASIAQDVLSQISCPESGGVCWSITGAQSSDYKYLDQGLILDASANAPEEAMSITPGKEGDLIYGAYFTNPLEIQRISASGYNRAHAYASSIIFENNIYYSFFCSPNRLPTDTVGVGNSWDMVRYMSSMDGISWSAPKPTFRPVNNSTIENTACDPSVFKYGSSYYMITGGCIDNIQGALYLSKSSSLTGPWLRLLETPPGKTGLTWGNASINNPPRKIILPRNVGVSLAGANNEYGVGQPSVVVIGSTIHLWYYDKTWFAYGTEFSHGDEIHTYGTSIDDLVKNGMSGSRRTPDQNTGWSDGTWGMGSAEVKWNDLTKRFEKYFIYAGHTGPNFSLGRARLYKWEAIAPANGSPFVWTNLQAISELHPWPSNVGVSTDPKGWLNIVNGKVNALVQYGGTYIERENEPNWLFGQIDMFGGFINPTTSQILARRPLVYVLAGQSNMEGSGDITELVPTSFTDFDETFMYCGERCGQSVNNKLVKMNSSVGFSLNETLFGPEMTFARDLHKKTGRRIYLIKYAVGGTRISGKPNDSQNGISTWSPLNSDPIENHRLFQNLVNVVGNGLKEIRTHLGDQTIGIDGLVWMQGESDALDGFSDVYGDSLKLLFGSIKQQLAITNFVVGELSDYPSWAPGTVNITRYQQRKVSAANENVSIVKTRDLEKISQGGILIHFNSKSLMTLGSRMANAAQRQLNHQRPEITP